VAGILFLWLSLWRWSGFWHGGVEEACEMVERGKGRTGLGGLGDWIFDVGA